MKPRPFSPLTKVTATACVAPEMGLVLGLTGTSMPDIERSPLPTRNVIQFVKLPYLTILWLSGLMLIGSCCKL